MKKTLHIPRVFGHSLMKINKDMSENLKNDFKISTRRSNGDILIQHYVSEIKEYTNFKKKILIQPIDGTHINKCHIDNINKYDLIITPSIVGKKIMQDNGVTKPIEVIANYYDESLLEERSDYFDQNLKSDKFTFYSETTGIKRKNVENIIKHYQLTFNKRHNVRLIVKLSTTDQNRINYFRSLINKEGPEVVIISEFLKEEELESIMRGIDCYICLSFMEGFCIPLLKAAVLKKRIIALDSKISGYIDFLDKENASLIPCKEIEIEKSEESLLIYSDRSKWEQADLNSYRKALKDNFNKRTKPFSKNMNKFSKKEIMLQYSDLLNNTHTFNFGRFYLPDDEGSNWMKHNKFREWEVDLNKILKRLDKQKNIVDIGAHIGYTVTKFHSILEGGRIFAFEPSDISYEFLNRNIQLNRLNKVEVFKIAIGGESKMIQLSNSDNLFINHVLEKSGNTQMRTLDSFEFENVGLIKIDVEGYEQQVLNGCVETIKKNRPLLIIEIRNDIENDVINFIKKLGYEKQTILDVYPECKNYLFEL
jgi:FkbM family methyltransferase